MNTFLENLLNKKYWQKILRKCEEKVFFSSGRLKVYHNIIEKEIFKEIALRCIEGNYNFSPPRQIFINRQNKLKRKMVFQLKPEDEFLSRVLQYLMNRKFSKTISPYCYSFQPFNGVKKAWYKLRNSPYRENWGMKLDISNYFNSIPIDKLLYSLPSIIKDDKPLYSLIVNYLSLSEVKRGSELIACPHKGVMAGTPLAPFLSNLYLKDMDDYFSQKCPFYCRYSDDIILFSRGDEKDYIFEEIKNFIHSKKLSVNYMKTTLFSPGESFEFLGFFQSNNIITISPFKIEKIKAKIKRMVKKYRRSVEKKNIPPEKALKYCIRRINKTFYSGRMNDGEFTWSRWYFPVIDNGDPLRVIDRYIQERLRYLGTGKNIKSNYRAIPYPYLVKLGYIPLFRAYWMFKKDFELYQKKIIKNKDISLKVK